MLSISETMENRFSALNYGKPDLHPQSPPKTIKTWHLTFPGRQDALPTSTAPFQSAGAPSINKPLERPKNNIFFSSRGHPAAFQTLCILLHYQNSFCHPILELPDCLNNPNVSIVPLKNTNNSQAKLELSQMKIRYLWSPEFQSLFYGLNSSEKDHKSTESPQVQLFAFGSSKIFKIT